MQQSSVGFFSLVAAVMSTQCELSRVELSWYSWHYLWCTCFCMEML